MDLNLNRIDRERLAAFMAENFPTRIEPADVKRAVEDLSDEQLMDELWHHSLKWHLILCDKMARGEQMTEIPAADLTMVIRLARALAVKEAVEILFH